MSVTEVHDIAVEYVDAGLSIVPIRLDGTKTLVVRPIDFPVAEGDR